jgi:hypothetical protein
MFSSVFIRYCGGGIILVLMVSMCSVFYSVLNHNSVLIPVCSLCAHLNHTQVIGTGNKVSGTGNKVVALIIYSSFVARFKY